MKKVIIIISLVLGIAVLSGVVLNATGVVNFSTLFNAPVDESVIATVNGVEIDRSSIEYIKVNNQKQMEYLDNNIDSFPLSQEQKEEILAGATESCNKTEEEILNDFIEREVMLQEAQRLNLAIDEAEARKVAEEGYKTIVAAAQKEDATEADKYTYECIVTYIKTEGLTEDEYLQRSGDVQVKAAYCAALIEYFEENIFEPKYLEDDAKAAFDIYIDELVKKQNVRIYN